MTKPPPRSRPADREHGFTLVELLITVSLMGLIAGVLATAFVASARGNDRVQAALPAARGANALNFWLASDISSAVPVNAATWLSTAPGSTTGCSSSPAGTTNVLRIETRNPIDGVATYVASYRYAAPVAPATSGVLWRVFCRSGSAPSSSSLLVEDIDPANPPIGCGDTVPCPGSAVKLSGGMSFKVVGRGVTSSIDVKAAVRVPAVAPPIATSTTTTLVPKPACAYVIPSSASPGSIARVPGPGNNARALSGIVTISVTTNISAGALCTALIAATNGLTCVLVRVGATDVWSAPCWGPATLAMWKGFYAVIISDRVDPSDLTADVPLFGPPVSFTVT